MTRRDIIIIAVLVNAGLLAILFMMAVTSEEEANPETTTEVVSIVDDFNANEEKQSPGLPLSKTPTDEVDQAIQALNDPSTPQPIIIEDEAFELEDNEEIELEQPKEDPTKPIVPQPMPETPKKSAATTKASANDGKKIEVTVKKGDSLDKIARANGTTIKALKEANQLKNDRLKVGQVLQLPASSEKKSISKEKPTVSKKETEIADADPQYYTLKNGDNPWKIAKKFHIKVDDFLKLNNMTEEKARNLKVGEKVRVK